MSPFIHEKLLLPHIPHCWYYPLPHQMVQYPMNIPKLSDFNVHPKKLRLRLRFPLQIEIKNTVDICKPMVSNGKCKYLHWQKSNQMYSGVKSTKMSTWHSRLIIARWLKQGVATLRFDQNYTLPVVDLWQWSQHVPPQQSKIFSNSCSFLENLAKSYVGAGSAPDYTKYLDQFLMVLLATFTSV